jgi:hypothetical protein
MPTVMNALRWSTNTRNGSGRDHARKIKSFRRTVCHAPTSCRTVFARSGTTSLTRSKSFICCPDLAQETGASIFLRFVDRRETIGKFRQAWTAARSVLCTVARENYSYAAMTTLLAKGQPLGPTGSFVGAAVALLVCVYGIVSIFKPSIRGRWGRGGSGGPMSAAGCAAWAIAGAAWSFCLFCHGINYQPVDRNPLPILLTAVVVVLLAGIGDSIYFWRPKKSAMKSFRVYLKEPTELEQPSKKR